MESLGSHLLLSTALIFVIEGLIYALFPGHVQLMMKFVTEMTPERLRYFGASMIALGVLLVFVIQKFLNYF
ncbi:MAG: DUF2065 domain-containing protein [Pseudomonadota bacterium]